MADSVGVDEMLAGKSFYACAAATGNALSPTVENLVRGTSSAVLDADRNHASRHRPLGEVLSLDTAMPSHTGIDTREQPGET